MSAAARIIACLLCAVVPGALAEGVGVAAPILAQAGPAVNCRDPTIALDTGAESGILSPFDGASLFLCSVLGDAS